MRVSFMVVSLLLLVVRAMAEEVPRFATNAQGMIRHLVDWPAEVECRAGIWVVRDDWKRIRQQWDLKDVRHSPFAQSRTIDGRFEFDDAAVHFRQRIQPDRVSYELTPTEAMKVTGLFWCLELPVAQFGGGKVQLGKTALTLPLEKQTQKAIGGASSDSIIIDAADGSQQVSIRFPESRSIHVQDAREFGEQRFQILVSITDQPLRAGVPIGLSATLKTRIAADTSDVAIDIDAESIQSEFDGFGGNFVYAIEDPATRMALDSFKLTWARVGMELAKWEPENDNEDPSLTDIAVLSARDAPGSALRRRFELDRELGERAGGRVIASVWAPPKWMFSDGQSKGSLARERWDELAECITSYLLHLKTSYGVEPALFSFNESDIGIDVLLSGEELRDMTKLLGERFAAAGLRTKLLLGDSADLKKGLEQISPTLGDPQAMKHIGAAAYHTWNDQSAHWNAWAEMARKRGLMLMTTEMGDDPSAWQDGSFNSPVSTLHLARKYIAQLRDAQTQVILEWEWTGDYPVAVPDVNGKLTLARRGQFLRQITQTTPTQSNVVKTACNADSVIAATVVADDRSSLAVHLLNEGGGRIVRVRGVPAPLTHATLFVIDLQHGEIRPQRVEATQGACEFRLPAGAVATLSFPHLHETD